ncbi:Mov34-domain-containing protein [Rhizoclosmatium globosum]|uniref:COP9 signalosome complex subunit 5 n=1 Tax=Rhizoclosmatium globosum TaxID=329046 RepID=A0A1Y1ZIA7_9FUNG|nr:Mov34-domain-containing protein [Rhizoclosmatium globosum]|eukprot:ORY09944.1 Mov34-domain-containing protein [Rhizoclosmatium globosum]
MQAQDAFKTFALNNNITEVDNIFAYDNAQQQQIMKEKPWTKDPNHFKKVRISAVALVKMVMHARSGGSIEVMGLMQGKVVGDQMIVMDAFALPVEGTETRVNAAQEGYEYMVDYVIKGKEVGRLENVIGWYHSHPGYGCWLSGIDVSTQLLNQTYQEPSAPLNTKASLSTKLKISVSMQTDIRNGFDYFTSAMDKGVLELLWNKYWVGTLSANPILANRDYTARQIADLADKIEQSEVALSRAAPMMIGEVGKKKGGKGDASSGGELAKVSKDGCKIGVESLHGVMAQVLKNVLFNEGV